ncbi:T9SS type A sorting domain-containing protein [Aquimarina sp. 2201CG1-2-11]|uniref:T9SS type A sorting domain-containing protein n=1 Tax=Aquimarina discodermiae TaxID=3231043 RepID=UPI003462174D
MKTIVCSVALYFVVSMGFSQFQHSFGTEKSEMGRSLDQLQQVEKGYIIGGYTSKNYIGSLEATLVKTDLNGNQIWSRVYGGENYEYFNSVRQSINFTFKDEVSYVAAGITRSFGFGSGDAYLVGVDVNGATVFSNVYGGKEYDVAHCVQSIKDQNGKPGYIFVGETRSYSQFFPGTNVYVVQTDHLGNLVRSTVIGGEGDQRGMWIEQTKDGGYIIAGATTNYWCGASSTLANPPSDIFIIKLKPDLTIEWNRIVGYPGELTPSQSYRNMANCVKQNNQGNYVLTGYTNSFGINNSFDAFLLYMGANGNFLGMKTYGTERRELGYGLEETVGVFGNQNYTIVGQNNISSTKAMMFQTDAGGSLLWARNYGKDGVEGGFEMTRDTYDKGFAFTGYTTSLGAGATDIYLVETTDTGKTGTVCEKEIKLEEVKHEPCITKSAQQVFVDEYERIQHKQIRVEYKQDRCIGFIGNEPNKGLGASENAIEMFPNPVNDRLTMQLGELTKGTQLTIFDTYGNIAMKSIDMGQKEHIEIDTKDLRPGMYMIKLEQKNGSVKVLKFLKK